MKRDNSAPEQTGKTGVDRRALLTAAGGIAATAAVGGAVWMGTAASQSKASDIVMMSAMDLSNAEFLELSLDVRSVAALASGLEKRSMRVSA